MEKKQCIRFGTADQLRNKAECTITLRLSKQPNSTVIEQGTFMSPATIRHTYVCTYRTIVSELNQNLDFLNRS